jgi:transcriptional regulator with XRE-family HTH domain
MSTFLRAANNPDSANNPEVFGCLSSPCPYSQERVGYIPCKALPKDDGFYRYYRTNDSIVYRSIRCLSTSPKKGINKRRFERKAKGQMEEQELRDVLGKKIKFFRLRKQFSQADLAEKANISITFLSNIERGNNFPQTGTLCGLAKALEVEVWELFRPEEAPDEQNFLIDRISRDFTVQVNLAMERVYRHYKV